MMEETRFRRGYALHMGLTSPRHTPLVLPWGLAETPSDRDSNLNGSTLQTWKGFQFVNLRRPPTRSWDSVEGTS